jgi:hypothetical protein
MFYWDDQIKENMMGGSSSALGEVKTSIRFWFENLKGLDLTEDLEIKGG